MAYYIDVVKVDGGVEKTLRVAYPYGGLDVDDAIAQDGGGVQTVYSASVELTDAQIKALPTTAIEMVAGQSGQILVPLCAYIKTHIETGYTNIHEGNTQMSVVYGDDDQEPLSSVYGVMNNAMLADTGEHSVFLDLREDDIGEAAAFTDTIDNVALNLYFYNFSDGDFIGGNAANTLKATVLYTIIDV
jgi:hypothetical protein